MDPRPSDYAVAEAGKRGIRLLVAFANYWQHYGGADAYNRWSFLAGEGRCDGELACRDDFFSDPYARRLYKNHVAAVIGRVNTFTGVRYRDDPAIFGWNLMNEPRSTKDLTVEVRSSSDKSLEYNVSSNTGDALQAWIEEMTPHVKSLDPNHLLTVGSESFFGPSSPLYLYANPGPWAQLEGVDFVRNHAVPGIDFATMHVYVDQWLCVERGATKTGRDEFFVDWLTSHQQAAEEELMMPVVLEEFGGKLEERYDLFKLAFDSFYESALRGGGGGGVMFWILYHRAYEPLDKFGGGYGVYPASDDDDENDDKVKNSRAVTSLIKSHAMRLRELNAKSANGIARTASDACYWSPPAPLGVGCKARLFLALVPIRPRWRGERRSLIRTLSPGASFSPPRVPRSHSRHAASPFNSSASDAPLDSTPTSLRMDNFPQNVAAELTFGGMPWRCLPGEREDVSECAPRDDALRERLYRQPPEQWRASRRANGALPVNTVESLVMGQIVNRGSVDVNLKGAWFVVPFSRGVHTEYEGEWTRMRDPNADMDVMCWYAGVHDANTGAFVQPYRGDLCRTGALRFSFTTHEWPAGTKARSILHWSPYDRVGVMNADP